MSPNSAANRFRDKRGRRGKNIFRLDSLESRLLLSSYAFSDDFNETVGGGPSSAWGAENPTDPNNNSVIYTNTLPAQATAQNPATMQVINDPQALDGKALAMSLMPAPGHSGEYYSAEISTKFDPSGLGNNLEYGHVEARIKIPGGNNSNAIWPAFWMLGTDITQVGWPTSGEIDVMENKGSQPGTIYSTLHGPGGQFQDYNNGQGVGSSYTLPNNANFWSSYHVFAVDWGPGSVTFSVDGVQFVTFTRSSLPSGATWEFDGHPFYIILDVNEGGGFAPGTITSTQTMDVDYVHATAYNIAAAPGLADQDIGSPSPAGSAYFDGDTNTLFGGGTGIGGTSDKFNFDSQQFTGDVTLITQVDWIGDSAQFAKGGLMIRNGNTAGAPYAFMQIEPYGGGSNGKGGVTFEYRATANSASVTAGTDTNASLINGPIWLKLVRNGNVFSAYDSTNGGSTWTQIGPSETISMNLTAQVGLAATSNTSSSLSTDTFSALSILPGTLTDTNIGGPGRYGTAAFNNSNSTLSSSGGGAGITGTSDQFNFANQSLTGDGSIFADFNSMNSTNALASAGIMFRNDTTAGAAFAMLAETPSGGLEYEWRSSAGATAQSTNLSGVNAPWIKLLRSGNSFTAFYSTNDINWTQIGAAQTVTMGSTALVGTAVTVGDNTGAINVASFSTVSVANAPAKLVYLSPPGNTTAGSPFQSNVIVAVEDANGNLVLADTSNITLSAPGSTIGLQGTVTVTAQNGVATFSNLATSAPGSGSLSATDGSLTPAASTSITVSNPAGMSVSAGGAYAVNGYPGSQTLDAQGGTVTLSVDQSANFPSMGLTIEPGASVLLLSDQHLSSLQINAGASLNVNNTIVYLNYGSGADPISSIAGWIKSGYNNGLWNGPGIISSAAAANSASYGLGFADSADPGNPAGLPSGTIKIMYTLLGDADLNGIVNGIDLGIVSANFNAGATGWDQGDFDYSGIVNGIDFGDVAANFNQGASGTAVTTITNAPTATAAPTTATSSTNTKKKPTPVVVQSPPPPVIKPLKSSHHSRH